MTSPRNALFDAARLGLALVLSLAATGCPGTIPPEERERFVGGGSSCGIGVGNVPSAILSPRCATSGCHDSASRAGGLDLASPNVGMRLLGVPSSTCAGRTLVVAGDTTNSFFYQKLNPNPACGTQMPSGLTPLAATDLACIRAWLRSLGSTPTDAGFDAVTVDATDVPVPTDTPMPMDTPTPMDTPVPMDTPTPMDTGETDAADTGETDAEDTATPVDEGVDTGPDDATPSDTGSDDAAAE